MIHSPAPDRLSGAVSSEQTRASQVGTNLLRAGGNAADAMIGTVLAIGLLAPYHSDLGGGGFCLIRDGKGGMDSLDFRHCAPKAITMDYLKSRPDSVTAHGGLAVAVPGHVRGLEALHKKYGRLPWARCFEEVIRMAEEGFEMRQDLHEYTNKELSDSRRDGSWMQGDAGYDFLFHTDGAVKQPADTIRRPIYAQTLRKIAEEGADAFYTGDMAEALVQAVRGKEGLMTLEDLRDYRVRWNTPLSIDYRDYKLWSAPAPASGAVWLSAMGVLGEFELQGEGSVLDLHRTTEAMRLAYAQRTLLGDPDFVPGGRETQLRWISADAIKERAEMMDDSKTFPPDYYLPAKVDISADLGTSHIITTDSSGLCLSLTTTVGLPFGSRIIVPRWGFVLNDSMDDFSIEGRSNHTGYAPSAANYVQGGKRPLSSSCPYIVEDKEGRLVAAGGAAGGSTIISANTQVARNLLDYNMSAAEALRANRLHNQVLPNVSQVERSSTHQGISTDGFSVAQASELEKKGHVLEWVPQNRSVPAALRVSGDGKFDAAGDPRKSDSGGSVFYA